MERNRAPKRPAPSRVTAKSKLKVFDFDFSGDDVDTENQSGSSSKVKVPSSKAVVINPTKDRPTKFRSDQSDLTTKAKPTGGTTHIDRHGNSTANSNSRKDSPQNGSGELFTDQITACNSSNDITEPIFSSTARGDSPVGIPSTSQNINKLSKTDRFSSLATNIEPSVQHTSRCNPTSTSKNVTANLSAVSKVAVGTGTTRQANVRRVVKRTQPGVYSVDEVKGQSKGIKRIKTDTSNTTDVCAQRVKEVCAQRVKDVEREKSRSVSRTNDVQKSQSVISEIATRTRSTSKPSLQVMSPLDELLESPVKKVHECCVNRE